MKHTPNCIKCRNKYDSDEPDDYYCASCLKDKQAIAEEVDRKVDMRHKRKAYSELKKL